ncbi:MAG TPA: DUF1694 domain-containing protein [Symbiobacteriaceae bacterium]|nr:DUF1694 domain-containing protein [Symbiobacteriaceae bacterium]
MPEEFWSKKSETEKALLAGMHGAPELRKAERDELLGEFPERVLASITKEQVGQERPDPAIVHAMENPQAKTVVVHADVPYHEAHKYKQLADEHHLAFTMRGDPNYEGDVGLIVVTD